MEPNDNELVPDSIHSEIPDIEEEEGKLEVEEVANEGDLTALGNKRRFRVFGLLNIVYIIIAYLVWLFPPTGCFGCHWFLTLRKVKNPILLGHTFTRIILISFFHATFWFTRLFVCDYHFMAYPGFLPWHDSPSCRDGSTHTSGCFGTEVTLFLGVHLIALFLFLALWVADGLTLGCTEVLLNATTRRRKSLKDAVENPENKELQAMKKGTLLNITCYSVCVLISSGVLAFNIGLFFCFCLNIITGGFGTTGVVQGVISLVISSLLTLLAVLSAGVWVFLYCVT